MKRHAGRGPLASKHQQSFIEHDPRDVGQIELLRIRNRKPLKPSEFVGCAREVVRIACKRHLAENAEKEPRVESPRKAGRRERPVEVHKAFGAGNQARAEKRFPARMLMESALFGCFRKHEAGLFAQLPDGAGGKHGNGPRRRGLRQTRHARWSKRRGQGNVVILPADRAPGKNEFVRHEDRVPAALPDQNSRAGVHVSEKEYARCIADCWVGCVRSVLHAVFPGVHVGRVVWDKSLFSLNRLGCRKPTWQEANGSFKAIAGLDCSQGSNKQYAQVGIFFRKFFRFSTELRLSFVIRWKAQLCGLETTAKDLAMTRRATSIFIAGLAASGILAGTASIAAADGGRKGGHWHEGHHGGWGMIADPISFEQLDVDGNGEISKEEFDARYSAWIAAADASGDGMLQKEELEAYVMEQARAMIERNSDSMFNRLDSDGDGAVGDAELQEKMGRSRRDSRMFSWLDSDGSGSVSAEEFESASGKMDRRRNGWNAGRNGDNR